MTALKSLCLVMVLLASMSRSTASELSTVDEKSIKHQDMAAKKGDSALTDVKGSAIPKSPKTFECIQEDTECNKDKLGYEAIAHLHRLIDDDHNGNVDQSESDEFLRDELQYTDGFERHSLFHNNDKLISVDDLWRAWKFSQVYNWTVDEVVDWLQNEVDLPQYSSIFLDNSVTGSFLPRLASSNTFMTTILGIKNPVHKQKLALKAMDTVLFGAPPKRHSYIKDLVLVASLIFAIGGCWFACLHYRYSQAQVRKMMVDLESLQKAEDALMDVQRKLEDAESRQISAVPRPVSEFKEGTAVPHADLPHVDNSAGEGTQQIREELAATLLALQQAETQLENSWSPPGELQAWLQLTHELEQLHYNTKRQAAERQFQSAKEVCDKIKRRNKAFFGSLRMAHSNSLDEIDQRILDARMALEEVKQDLQERLQRWHTIEQLCGFPVITNPGLPTLHQILYGTKEGIGGTRLSSGNIMSSGSMEETEEDMSQAGYPSLPTAVANKPFLRQQAISGSTVSLSQASRSGINVKAAYTTASPHPGISLMHRGSNDLGLVNHVSTPLASSESPHHGDQSQDFIPTLSYHPQQTILASNNHNRNRSTSITPSVVSSVQSAPTSLPTSGYNSYGGQASAGQSASEACSSGRPYAVDNSDDNLSQATLDSLPQGQSSGNTRDCRQVGNGLDLVSHTQQVGRDGAILTPRRLEKKPSKRKKLLNMFKKSNKEKAA